MFGWREEPEKFLRESIIFEFPISNSEFQINFKIVINL